MRKLVSTVLVGSIGFTILGGYVSANEYPNSTNGISDVSAQIIIGENGGPAVPSVDPSNPEPPIENTNQNGIPGALSIRYISDINFPDIEISTEPVTVFAELDKGIDDEEFDNLVSVQDFRNEDERNGWELTVRMSPGFISGSELTMKPFIHPAVGLEYAVIAPNNEILIGESSQVFARTQNNNNPSGIISMNLVDSDTDGVKLSIPANTPVGNYSTTLVWNMSTGPTDL